MGQLRFGQLTINYLLICCSLILVSSANNCVSGQNYCVSCVNFTSCGSCQEGYGTNQTFISPYYYQICQPCLPTNCKKCSPQNNCTQCRQRFRSISINGTNQCEACSVTFCKWCNATVSICQECLWSYRVINGGTQCQRCLVTHCGKCQLDVSICQVCSDNYGVSAGLCLDCFDPQCHRCNHNYSNCYQCFQGYGVSNHNCELCSDINCFQCNSNYLMCTKCKVGYGLSNGQCYACNTRNCSTCSQTNVNECYTCFPTFGLTQLKQCFSCLDVNCWLCSSNYSNCTQCKTGYGYRNGNPNNSCQPCEQPCNECLVANNLNCTSCITGYYIVISLYSCEQCQNDIQYCQQCVSATNCTKCKDGYYVNASLVCQICPEHCTSCFYNYLDSSVECTSCQSLIFHIVSQIPKLCKQLCGDYLVEHSPCDLGLGLQYDGCLDNCQVQYGFECQHVNNSRSVCSFANETQMQIVMLTFGDYSNTVYITIKLWPPLYVFKTSGNLMDVFLIRDPIFTVKGAVFSATNSSLVMEVEYSSDFYGELTIEFVPNQALDQRYFASVNSSASKLLNLQFYSPAIFNICRLTNIISIIITSFGMVGILVGLVTKRLAGLQAVLTFQVYWISIVFINSYLFLPFKEAYPIKFTTGYHATIFNQNTPNNSRLLIQAQKDSTSQHLQQFRYDQQILANNFNILLILQVVPLIVYLVLSAIQQYNKVKRKQLEENSQFQQMLQLKKLNTKVTFLKQISAQCLLCFGYLNLINFSLCIYIFFIQQQSQFHLPSFIVLGISSFTYFMTALVFCVDPDPFDYFRYAFKKNRIGMAFYYTYAPILLSITIIVFMLPNYTWASLLPLSLVIPFVLLYRPYKQIKQNYRSAFNMVVIQSCLSLRVYLQYSSQPQKITNSYIYNFFNLMLLFIVMVVSYVSLIYHIVYICILKPKDEKNDEEKVMMELEQINVRNKMKQIKEDSIVFKKLLQPRMNILQFSNSLIPVNEETDEKQQQNGEMSNRKIRKQIEKQRLGKNQIRQIAQIKYEYINDLRQKIQVEEGAELTKEQKAEIEQNHKIVYAMDVMAKQNQFIRLKNAKDYTVQLIKQKQENPKHELYIASYQQI